MDDVMMTVPARNLPIRTALTIGDWREYTIPQIADVLDCSEDSVRKCISRIKAEDGIYVQYNPQRRRNARR